MRCYWHLYFTSWLHISPSHGWLSLSTTFLVLAKNYRENTFALHSLVMVSVCVSNVCPFWKQQGIPVVNCFVWWLFDWHWYGFCIRGGSAADGFEILVRIDY
jgi:hypothetical protein